MKHTTKLLTVLATVIAVFSLTGCPKPVGEIDDEPIEVVHEHSWGEGVITTEPTCTKKGVRTFTCECGAKRTEEVAPLGHDFQGGYCERCGTYEFNGENDYQLEIEIYKTNISKTVKTCKDWFDNKTKVDTVYFSFNKSTLSNYKEITVYEVYMGEVDENGEEIPTQRITVNLNELILLKTSYNIIEICDGNVLYLYKGHNLFQVLVE